MDSIVSFITLAEQIILEDGIHFPLVISPKLNSLENLSDTVSFVEKHREELLVHLRQCGAILFRDFPITDASAFDTFARAFNWMPLPYVGGAAPRQQVTSIVFTSNESPPSEPIPFHHEMAQVPKFPEHLMFFCDVPSTRGGETPIAYSPMIYNRISEALPEFVQKLEEKKIRYTRVLPNGDDPQSAIGRGWQSTYQTEDRDYAEKVCHEQGTDYEWLDDGCLKTTTKILPAIRLDEQTGKKTWFNSIVAAYTGWSDKRNYGKKAVTFADGELMNEEDIHRCVAILEESSVSFTWKKGDVLLIDNRQVLHARKSFEPPRRILAALFQ
ncbi:unnamed protein product [Rotaria socialis]|uniref:TauD/TfdA-like domain-containing protein n=1 Tax=Rotaria socialis TaxID=392032 RepID=A0A821LQ25_9BILA|nr:unnamed protein product [Rotaria socialis]CAF3795003.1 unnamed protein product [Rotaria socialis]CAF4498715.1 unnamed protein product [Rotaria socialis]CAF4753871.1 unnamed protein product [Rotaria socialis]